MTETAASYIARMSAFVGNADPMVVLADTPRRLRSLAVRGDAAGRARPPAPGRWSVNQIAAHLADNELVAGYRLRMILASDGTPLQPYDQDVWASAFKYNDVEAAESAALFDALRAGTLRLLERVDPARFEHHGLHAERGRETVTHLVRFYAGHDLNHLRQIEEILRVDR